MGLGGGVGGKVRRGQGEWSGTGLRIVMVWLHHWPGERVQAGSRSCGEEGAVVGQQGEKETALEVEGHRRWGGRHGWLGEATLLQNLEAGREGGANTSRDVCTDGNCR